MKKNVAEQRFSTCTSQIKQASNRLEITMNKDKLVVTEIKGSALEAGRAYGEGFGQMMMGFCRQELKPDKRKIGYARKCWKHTVKHAPESARFIEGMAQGSGLSLDHVGLLTLHEEVYHEPHCTAFAATGSATRAGKTVVAMNWDWATNLYPWAGLLKLTVKGAPRVATYHYPGLWACAGVNEYGMTLMWTGGGYLPKVPPMVGVPTYVLIAEVLRRNSVQAAVDYLAGVPIAGCFIFHLGDAAGNIAIVEGAAGKQAVDRTGDVLFRANHYTCRDIVACSKQTTPLPRKNATTVFRYERMKALMEEHGGKISVSVAKKVLTDRHGAWPWIHQFPGGKDSVTLGGMTIDSLFAVAQERALYTCRGGRTAGPWQVVEA
jgi:predicted choloylglycine hydrolase